MSNDLAALPSLTESSTEVPVSAGQVENYVLLLVLLSIFAGGTLVLLSLLLLFCHRCCMGGRRYSRASDDLEKTNTTYAEDSQPTQEITIHLDESDGLSTASCHDGESERFVSTGYTGRRVSFNESALYEKEKTTQSDKVRRYTLTEGDFHHLKKARLTHLHLPPAPCDLKILTIMECDSAGSSTNNISEPAAPSLPVTIYQPSERRLLDWTGQGLSGGLPGDTCHSTILELGPGQAFVAMKKRPQTVEAVRDRREAEKEKGTRTQVPGQTSVLHFLSKLRRHASLEGAGPYFKRWKFDSSHRAASLDAKGSPKRRPFQRQRAASETADHTEDDPPEVIDSEAPVQAGGLQALSAESLSRPGKSALHDSLNLEVGSSSTAEVDVPASGVQAQRPKEATEHVTGEEETQFGSIGRTEVTREDVKKEAAVQGRSKQSTEMELGVSHVRKRTEEEVEDGDESVSEAAVRGRADSGSSLSFMIRQESLEAAPSLYRDIWSLRASLEQYVSSDQSSTDHESVRSDPDSASSLCGAGGRSGLDSCLSQDLDDDPDGDAEADVLDASRGNNDVGSGAGGEAEAGNRKLLQMDSGYASIEAPSRAPEEMRLFGTPGAPRGKTASERRMFFTSSGRKGSVCESIEAKLFQEELEDEMTEGAEENPKTCGQPRPPPQDPPKSHQDSQPLTKVIPSASSPHKPRLRHRDYSIDEKTDALFNEFLRHDPRFDQQDSPMRTRHRSRVHLRKQWQRHKQYSDPGSGAGGRYSPSLERQRFTPLRRGDSAGYPLDTRYHSTLSRIASAADEEASEVAACEEAAKGSTEDSDRPSEGGAGGAAEAPREGADTAESRRASSGHGDTENAVGRALAAVAAQGSPMDPRADNRNNNSSQAILSEVSLPAESDLADKLAASVEERLYGSLRGQAETDQVLRVSHTASPGFSPS